MSKIIQIAVSSAPHERDILYTLDDAGNILVGQIDFTFRTGVGIMTCDTDWLRIPLPEESQE